MKPLRPPSLSEQASEVVVTTICNENDLRASSSITNDRKSTLKKRVMCTSMYICIYVCKYVAYMYVGMCVCNYVYAYVYVYV
jgi:hypothetical protein